MKLEIERMACYAHKLMDECETGILIGKWANQRELCRRCRMVSDVGL